MRYTAYFEQEPPLGDAMIQRTRINRGVQNFLFSFFFPLFIAVSLSQAQQVEGMELGRDDAHPDQNVHGLDCFSVNMEEIG